MRRQPSSSRINILSKWAFRWVTNSKLLRKSKILELRKAWVYRNRVKERGLKLRKSNIRMAYLRNPSPTMSTRSFRIHICWTRSNKKKGCNKKPNNNSNLAWYPSSKKQIILILGLRSWRMGSMMKHRVTLVSLKPSMLGEVSPPKRRMMNQDPRNRTKK